MDDHGDIKKSASGKEASLSVAHGVIKPAGYLRAVKAHLRKEESREAFALLQKASVQYPDDPFILSYYGYLQAVVEKKYRAGVEKCKAALDLINEESVFGEEMLYPVFYLNLGRAYVAAGKKKEALEIFNNGLRFDTKNRELLLERRALGRRKAAPLPFLDRSNPLNKYAGLILHPKGKKAEKKK